MVRSPLVGLIAGISVLVLVVTISVTIYMTGGGDSATELSSLMDNNAGAVTFGAPARKGRDFREPAIQTESVILPVKEDCIDVWRKYQKPSYLLYRNKMDECECLLTVCTDYYGGEGGNAFSHRPDFRNGYITQLHIYSNENYLQSMRVIYGNTTATAKIGTHPNRDTQPKDTDFYQILFDEGEKITGICGTLSMERYSKVSLTVKTNQNNTFNLGPNEAIECYFEDEELLYFSGRGGFYIDGLQFHLNKNGTELH